MMPVDPESSGVIAVIFLKLSMREYAYDILAPTYPEKSVKELLAESHLNSIAETLQKSPRIRVFTMRMIHCFLPEKKRGLMPRSKNG